jgi:protein ImuB
MRDASSSLLQPSVNSPVQAPQKEMTTRRYLALALPFLPVERLRRLNGSDTPADQPLVLVARQAGGLRLVALSPQALAAGLRPGMSLSEARALLPAVVAMDAEVEADQRLLLALAAGAERYTPMVALDGVDGLMLDITGAAHLVGGEAALIIDLHRRLARLGLTGAIAIAGTPDAARLLARYLPGSVVPSGAEAAHVALLPVEALITDEGVRTALRRAGLVTIGDLAVRPPLMLTARFGADLRLRLARTLGQEDCRITPLRRPPDCMAEKHFPDPFSARERIEAALSPLAQQVSLMLERRGAGGRLFEAVFFRADGLRRRIQIETAAPLRMAEDLLRLIFLRLDTLADPLDPGFGFDALRLSVLRTEPMQVRQANLETGTEEMALSEAGLADLINRLVLRFGRENVLSFASRDTHDPVRASALVPAMGMEPRGKSDPVALSQGPGDPPLRPLTLFEHPQPLEALAEVPDGPPLRFRWRRALHDVCRAEGPERILPEWWQQGDLPARARDYYRVEDQQGRRFWLFREGLHGEAQPPRWFMQGLFG